MRWHFLLYLLFPLVLTAQTSASRLVMADAYEAGKTGSVPRTAYPTYDLYVRIMKDLAAKYPSSCRLENWGALPSGREILTLRITKDIAQATGRPQVLCTASMHGDETAGYWMLLRLAEDLLKNNPGRLTNELEIYINPLANPDGAFAGGNKTLSRSRRGNARGVDLNRNYPDPDDGAHPDRQEYQPETAIFMRAAREHSFDLAVNIHAGAEVFNYPWDTYRDRHADTDWWRRVSRDFAERAQAASGRDSYFQDRHNGVTNGHDWYPIAGSRQDYMNYYHRCREATLEISDAKRFPSRSLPELWTYASPSLLGYISEARYGFHGTVTDRYTGKPIRAKLNIPGHDQRNSAIFADGKHGDFHRYLSAGTYQIEFSANGYRSEWRTLYLEDGEQVNMDIELERLRPGSRPAKREKR